MYIVYFTKDYNYPQIFTLSENYDDCNNFFDTFCNFCEEIVSAILFQKNGDLVTVFNEKF